MFSNFRRSSGSTLLVRGHTYRGSSRQPVEQIQLLLSSDDVPMHVARLQRRLIATRSVVRSSFQPTVIATPRTALPNHPVISATTTTHLKLEGHRSLSSFAHRENERRLTMSADDPMGEQVGGAKLIDGTGIAK